MDAALTVRKGNTLGQLEEYARLHDFQILVYEKSNRQVLLHSSSVPKQLLLNTVQREDEQAVMKIRHDERDYYARQVAFELWDWHIVPVKDGEVYADFVRKISQSYYAIGVMLIFISLLLLFYFHRVVHHPVYPSQRNAGLQGHL